MVSKMCNGLSKIRHKIINSYPKLGKYRPKWYQKYQNLVKFVKLGCPDPTPTMYLMNLDSLLYQQAAVPLDVVKDIGDNYIKYDMNYWVLPPRPNSVYKMTGL